MTRTSAMRHQQLFPELGEGREYKRSAYPAAPGSGPEGRQCRDCAHFFRQMGGSRDFSKCDLRAGSHGPSTDISMYAKACSFFVLAKERQ